MNNIQMFTNYQVIVTQLKLSKPFLKVIVKNVNKNSTNAAEKLKFLYESELGSDPTMGQTCIAFVAKDRYERCRVIQINRIDKSATLMFIDCGYQGELPISRLRPLRDSNLIQEAPFCEEYILAEICLVANTPHQKVMNFHNMIVGNTFEMTVLRENEAGRYIDLKLHGNSLSNVLIIDHPDLSKMLKNIQLNKQMDLMIQMKRKREKFLEEKGMKPITLAESPEVEHDSSHDFPEVMLDKLEHSVRVTEFEDMPFHFFVQFIDNDRDYQRFQCDLQEFKDHLTLEKHPVSGTVAIAQIGSHLHRATVLSPSPSSMLKSGEEWVELMETGHKHVVSRDKLFKVPSKVSIVPSYAKRFKLANSEKLRDGKLLVEEIEFYFKHIAKYKLLMLKVVPMKNNEHVPSCSLSLNGTDILELCKNYDPHGLQYPKQTPLRKSAFQVSITSAESPKSFYIRSLGSSEQSRFRNIEKILKHYDSPVLRDPKINDVCVVMQDSQYMRGLISGHSIGKIFKVLFVDFGFTDECNINEIKVSVDELIAEPPLAYRCCLDGYENRVDVNRSVLKKFQKICENLGVAQMRVVDRRSETLLVDLEDSSDGSKIINKLREAEKFDKTGWMVDQSGCSEDNTDWTEDQPSINAHFRQRELERPSSPNESILTLVESPTKIDCQDMSDWDVNVIESTLVNSTMKTLVNAFDSNTTVASKDDDRRDWTTNSLWELKSLDGKNKDKKDATLTPSKPGTSSQLLKRQSSPASTSGVSSGETDSNVNGEAITISSITTPIDFTVQKISDADEYQKSLDSMQENVKALAPLTIFSKESLCLAFHKLRNMWCRCVIVDADLDNFLITVKCFDDGSTYSIDNKAELKTFPISTMMVRNFGERCSLPISYSFSNEEEIVRYLMGIRNDNLVYQVITKFIHIYFVEIYHCGKNVTNTLVEKGLAKRQVIVQDGQALISYLIDSTKFAIQMISSMEVLRQINEYTENYYHSHVDDPVEGMLVLGFSKKDQRWYRAKIESVKEAAFVVYFVDFGNSETVEVIGAFDNPSIARIPPVAIRCKLYLPPEIRVLNYLAEMKFAKVIEENKENLFVKMKRPGDNSATVEIFINNSNSILEYFFAEACPVY